MSNIFLSKDMYFSNVYFDRKSAQRYQRLYAPTTKADNPSRCYRNRCFNFCNCQIYCRSKPCFQIVFTVTNYAYVCLQCSFEYRPVLNTFVPERNELKGNTVITTPRTLNELDNFKMQELTCAGDVVYTFHSSRINFSVNPPLSHQILSVLSRADERLGVQGSLTFG